MKRSMSFERIARRAWERAAASAGDIDKYNRLRAAYERRRSMLAMASFIDTHGLKPLFVPNWRTMSFAPRASISEQSFNIAAE